MNRNLAMANRRSAKDPRETGSAWRPEWRRLRTWRRLSSLRQTSPLMRDR
jgi:hypothetical protein